MIAPYKRTPKPPAVGLVRADGRVLLDDGSIRKLADLPAREQHKPGPGIRLYMDRDLCRVRFLLRGKGRAVCWNEVPIRWLPDADVRSERDHRQVILLGAYPGDGPEILDGLVRFRDFLADHGAAISSPGSSSMSLLRATLTRSILIDGGERPPIGEVIGGRQEPFVEPGRYGSFVHYDLSAAYAKTLGTLVYPGKWSRWPGLPDADVEWPCFVRATVRVPREIVGPLPRRRRAPRQAAFVRRIEIREYPTGRSLTGTWELREFLSALQAGCKAQIHDVWMMVGIDERRPFEGWWSLIEKARKLPGYAGTLGKISGNALWGRFVTFGERTIVTYKDGRPLKVESYPIRTLPKEMQGLMLAETITGRVRARLYSEMIAPHRDRLISVHTDGGLLSITEQEPRPSLGDDWRPKDAGTNLTYINPQCFAFKRPGTGHVYKVSGVRPRDAKSVFDTFARIVLGTPSTTTRASLQARDNVALARLVEAFPEFAEQIGRPA